MKKVIAIILMFIPIVSMADMNLDLRNQMLDSEIVKYTNTRDEKYEALKQCEKNTKGFKIAGITTLIATGVGVYGNIKLAKDLKNVSKEQDVICDLSKLDANERAQHERWRDNTYSMKNIGYNENDLKGGEWEATFSFGVLKGESNFDKIDEDDFFECFCRITSFKPSGTGSECLFHNSDWFDSGWETKRPGRCSSFCSEIMSREDYDYTEYRRELYNRAK